MKFILFLVSIVVNNHALVQVNEPISTSDSPVLLKILQIVDSAINDDHLLYVTLKLLKSLCVCMRETLLHKEAKDITKRESHSALRPGNDLGQKELEIYKNIYDDTCINLCQKLNDKINKTNSVIIHDNSMSKNTFNCNKNYSQSTEMTQHISSHDLNTQLQNILHKVLLETKSFHKYNIKRFNLFRKSNKSLFKSIKNNVIVIFTLHYSKKNTNPKNEEEIDDREIYKVLNSNSTIDIDIIDTKDDEGLSLDHLNSDSATECQLRSLYSFLIDSERNNSIKGYKLLRRNGDIKIYLDIITNMNTIDISIICCHKNKSYKMCDIYSKNDTNEPKKLIDHEQINNTQKNTENYKDTISKIKTLIKLYDTKLTKEYDDNNAGQEKIKLNQDINKFERLSTSDIDLTINKDKRSPEESKRQFLIDYSNTDSNYSHYSDQIELKLSKNQTHVKERDYGNRFKTYTKSISSSKQRNNFTNLYAFAQNNNATSTLLLYGLLNEIDSTTSRNINNDKMSIEKRSLSDFNLSIEVTTKSLNNTKYSIYEQKTSALRVDKTQETPTLYATLPQIRSTRNSYNNNETSILMKCCTEKSSKLTNKTIENAGIHFINNLRTQIMQIPLANTRQQIIIKDQLVTKSILLHTLKDTTIINNDVDIANLDSNMESNSTLRDIEIEMSSAIPYVLTSNLIEGQKETTINFDRNMNFKPDIITELITQLPILSSKHGSKNIFTSYNLTKSSNIPKVLSITRILKKNYNSTIDSFSSPLTKSITIPEIDKTNLYTIQSTQKISHEIKSKGTEILFPIVKSPILYFNKHRYNISFRENDTHEYNKIGKGWKLSTRKQINKLATRGSSVRRYNKGHFNNSNVSVNDRTHEVKIQRLDYRNNYKDNRTLNKSFYSVTHNKSCENESTKQYQFRETNFINTEKVTEALKLFNENVTFPSDNEPNKNKNFTTMCTPISATINYNLSNAAATSANKLVTENVTQLVVNTTQHSKPLEKSNKLNKFHASTPHDGQNKFKGTNKRKNIKIGDNLDNYLTSTLLNMLEDRRAYTLTRNKLRKSEVTQRLVTENFKEPVTSTAVTYTLVQENINSPTFEGHLKSNNIDRVTPYIYKLDSKALTKTFVTPKMSLPILINDVQPIKFIISEISTSNISTTEINHILEVENPNQEYETQIMLPVKMRYDLITRVHDSENRKNITQITLGLKNRPSDGIFYKIKNKSNENRTKVHEYVNMKNKITTNSLKDKTNFDIFNGVKSNDGVRFYHSFLTDDKKTSTNAYAVVSQQSRTIVDDKVVNQSEKDQTKVLFKGLFTNISTPTLVKQTKENLKINLLNKRTTIGNTIIINSMRPTEEHMYLKNSEKVIPNIKAAVIDKGNKEIPNFQPIINKTSTNVNETKTWIIKKVVQSEKLLQMENGNNTLSYSAVTSTSRNRIKINNMQYQKTESVMSLLNKNMSKLFDNVSLYRETSEINRDNKVIYKMGMIRNSLYEGPTSIDALGYDTTKVFTNVTNPKPNMLLKIQHRQQNVCNNSYSTTPYLGEKLLVKNMENKSMYSLIKWEKGNKKQRSKPQYTVNVEEIKQISNNNEYNINSTNTTGEHFFKHRLDITTVWTTPRSKIEFDNIFTINSKVLNENGITNHFITLLSAKTKKPDYNTEISKYYESKNMTPKIILKNSKYSGQIAYEDMIEKYGNNDNAKNIYRNKLQNAPKATTMFKKHLITSPSTDIILLRILKVKADNSTKKSEEIGNKYQNYTNINKTTSTTLITAEVTNHISNKKEFTTKEIIKFDNTAPITKMENQSTFSSDKLKTSKNIAFFFTKNVEHIIPLSIYSDEMLIKKSNISKDEYFIENGDNIKQNIIKADRLHKGHTHVSTYNRNKTFVTTTPNNSEMLENNNKNLIHKLMLSKSKNILFTNTTLITINQTAQIIFKPANTITTSVTKNESKTNNSQYSSFISKTEKGIKVIPQEKILVTKMNELSHTKRKTPTVFRNDNTVMKYFTNFMSTTHQPMLNNEKLIKLIIPTNDQHQQTKLLPSINILAKKIFNSSKSMYSDNNRITLEMSYHSNKNNNFKQISKTISTVNNTENNKSGSSIQSYNASLMSTSIFWKRDKILDYSSFGTKDAKNNNKTKYIKPTTFSYRKVDIVTNLNQSGNIKDVKTEFKSFTRVHTNPDYILKPTKEVKKLIDILPISQTQNLPSLPASMETDEYFTAKAIQINNITEIMNSHETTKANIFMNNDNNITTQNTIKIANTSHKFVIGTERAVENMKITTGNGKAVLVKLSNENKNLNTYRNAFTDNTLKKTEVQRLFTDRPIMVAEEFKNITIPESFSSTHFNKQNFSGNITNKLKQEIERKFSDNIEHHSCENISHVLETEVTLLSKGITTRNDSNYLSSSNLTNRSRIIKISAQTTKQYLPIFLYNFHSEPNINIKKNGIKPIKISKVTISKSIYRKNNVNKKGTTPNKYSTTISANNDMYVTNKRIKLVNNVLKTSDTEPYSTVSSTISTTKIKKIKYNTYKPNSQEDFDSSDEAHALSTVPAGRNNKANNFSVLETVGVGLNISRKKFNNNTTKTKLLTTESQLVISSQVNVYNFSKKADKKEHTRIFIINNRNLFSNEAPILEHLGKTNFHPVKMSPNIQKKVLKRIRFENRKVNSLSINANKYFSKLNMVTQSNFYHNQYIKDNIPFSMNTATPLPKKMILKPKFGSKDKLGFVNNFRPKSLLIPNDKDFLHLFKLNGRRTAVEWRELSHNSQEMKNQLSIKPKFEAVMERPAVLAPPIKPRRLRDRIDSLRNYLYNTDYDKVTKSPRTKSYFFKTFEDSGDQIADYININGNYYESPKTTIFRTPRRGRTLFFLSPTAPYRRYF